MPGPPSGSDGQAFSASARSALRLPLFPQPCAKVPRVPAHSPAPARRPSARAALHGPGSSARSRGGYALRDGAARSRNAFRRWCPSGYAAHRPHTPSPPRAAGRAPTASAPPYRRTASGYTRPAARPAARSAARCTRGRGRRRSQAAFRPSRACRALRPHAAPVR